MPDASRSGHPGPPWRVLCPAAASRASPVLVAIVITCICYRAAFGRKLLDVMNACPTTEPMSRSGRLARRSLMRPATPLFHVRGRGTLSGFGLLALCAALAAGFVAATWRGSSRRASLDADQGAGTSSGLAICACPEARPSSSSVR